MSNSNNVGFTYGALSKKLEEQANEQGYTLGKDSEKLEKIRHGINMVGFHVATKAQVSSMVKKLHKMVEESLQVL